MICALVAQGLLNSRLARAPPRHRPVACSGDWMFVDVREGVPEDPRRQLEAIVDPFGRNLLVGEEQWHRVASPEGLLVLDVAQRNQSLLCRIPSPSCAGSDATIVRVVEVDRGALPRARLVGVGRCTVDGIAGKRPRLAVRVRAKPDEPLEGKMLTQARATAEKIDSLWERAVELFQRMQGLKLQVLASPADMPRCERRVLPARGYSRAPKPRRLTWPHEVFANRSNPYPSAVQAALPRLGVVRGDALNSTRTAA